MSTDAVRASFDRIAEQYAADFADELTRKPWDAERLRDFARASGAGPVVDVGCGAAGHVGRFVADLGPRVLGLDVSERSVAIARRLNPGLRFAAADVRALPLADGAATGIVAFYCLIYSAMEDVCAALRELRRVSRPGGRLLAAVHGGAGAQRFADYKGIAVDVELHYRQADTFAAAVKDAGFVVERMESRPPYPFEHPTERLYVSARRP